MRGKYLVLLFVLLLIPSVSMAATALWTPPTQNEDGTPLTDLSGFNLYETTGGGRVKVNTTLIPVSVCTGSPSTCTWALPSGTAIKGDKFVVTAVDSVGSESGDSNTATYGTKPKAPAGLIIQ